MYDFREDSTTKWPWARSLAMATPGQTVQIDRILFGAVKDECFGIGLREGLTLTCAEVDVEGVDVLLPSGELRRLPRHYAWFVSVKPV